MSQAQLLVKGNILTPLDSSEINYTRLEFIGKKKTYIVNSDLLGVYELHLDKGTYDVRVGDSTSWFGDSLVQNVTFKDKVNQFDIVFETARCPYSDTITICPLCQCTDSIIPIEYGFPNDEMIERFIRKEIYLGGCQLLNCRPRWYCQRYNYFF